MGEGYYILVWDGWGFATSMVNPRFVTRQVGKVDSNWFSCTPETTVEHVLKEHGLEGREHVRVLFDRERGGK